MIINNVQPSGVNFGRVKVLPNHSALSRLKSVLDAQGKLDEFQKEYKERRASKDHHYTLVIDNVASGPAFPNGAVSYKYRDSGTDRIIEEHYYAVG